MATELYSEKYNPFMQAKTFIVSAFIMFAVGISMLWGSHSIEMLGLKTKTVFGSAGTKDLYRVVEICYSLNNPSCAINALENIRQYEPNNIEVVGQMASLYEKSKDYDSALVAFASYFSNGGANAKYRMAYAKALASMNMFNQASKQFDLVIAADKFVFSDTASRFYVNMLMKQGEYYKATKVVAAIKRKGGKVGYLGEYVDRQIAKTKAPKKSDQIDTTKDMYDLIISEEKTLVDPNQHGPKKRIADSQIQ